MKISIITPTYNSSGTIRDTLNSIKNQTYPDIESIVVDGASTDNTVRIVGDEFGDLSTIVSERDQGIYDAMNKGIRRSSGDIIGVLNSDDFYAHNRVIESVAECFGNSDFEGLYGDLCYVDNKETQHIVRKWVAGDFSKNRFLYGWMPPHPTFFVKKKIYEQFGLFDLRLKSAADYEIMLRFIYKNEIKLGYLPDVLVNMRVGGISNASLGNRIRANKEDRMAWKMNGLKPYFFTRYMKPIRKLNQFLRTR